MPTNSGALLLCIGLVLFVFSLFRRKTASPKGRWVLRLTGLLLIGGSAALFVLAPEGSDRTLGPRPSTDSAAKAAEELLSLIDQEKYSDAWHKIFQPPPEKISEAAFVGQLETERKPMGQVHDRILMGTNVSRDTSDMPGGRRGSFGFRTTFASGQERWESVTTEQYEPGKWRILGYEIAIAGN